MSTSWKVGDRFKCTKAGGEYKEGDTGTIVEVHPNGVHKVSIDGKCIYLPYEGKPCSFCFALESKLEKIGGEIMKEGDRIEVVNVCGLNIPVSLVGKKGTVMSTTGEPPFGIKFDDGTENPKGTNKRYWFDKENLRLIPVEIRQAMPLWTGKPIPNVERYIRFEDNGYGKIFASVVDNKGQRIYCGTLFSIDAVTGTITLSSFINGSVGLDLTSSRSLKVIS